MNEDPGLFPENAAHVAVKMDSVVSDRKGSKGSASFWFLLSVSWSIMSICLLVLKLKIHSNCHETKSILIFSLINLLSMNHLNYTLPNVVSENT